MNRRWKKMVWAMAGMLFSCLWAGECRGGESDRMVPVQAGETAKTENGVLKNSVRKELLCEPEGGFREGYFYEFGVPYNVNRFQLRTGETYDTTDRAGKPVKAAQRIDLNSRKDVLRIQGFSARGHQAVDLTVNYSMPPRNFSNMDSLARREELTAEKERRDLTNEWARFGVEVAEGKLRLFLNGVFMFSQEFKGKTENLKLAVPATGSLRPDVLVRPSDPLYYRVDLSERANKAGFDGKKLAGLPAGKEVRVDGVPFLISSHPEADHVDLYWSLAVPGIRGNYQGTSAWTRWPDAALKTPLRFQFRVPGGDYDELCVLAASAEAPHANPRFTVQLYRARSGRPMQAFSGNVPFHTAKADGVPCLELKDAAGKPVYLYLVRVALPAEAMLEYGRDNSFMAELTKDVRTYRTYPDSLHHSVHAAGFPSAVHIFGITFRSAPVNVAFDPCETGNVFTEGQKAAYNVKLKNLTDKKQTVPLKLSSKDSFRGEDVHSESREAVLNPGEEKTVTFEFMPRLFGHHEVHLEAAGRDFRRSMVYMRKRDYTQRPLDAEGLRFGCWCMQYTPLNADLVGRIGFDTFGGGLRGQNRADDPEIIRLMRKYGMISFGHAVGRVASGITLDSDENKAYETCLAKQKAAAAVKLPEDLFKQFECGILTEPGGINVGNAGFGEYYGEEPYDVNKLPEPLMKRYLSYKKAFLIGRKASLEVFPGSKILMPHGNWNFVIPFLQDPETRDLVDGTGMDFQFYTRLPEQQIHQCSLHSIYFYRQAWKKYRKDDPVMIWTEGPDISPIMAGAMDEYRFTAHAIRISVIMAAYGAKWQTSHGTSPFDDGETHCSGGIYEGQNRRNPHQAVAAWATWSRHTRHAKFLSYTNPGSFSAWCANFLDTKTGKVFRVIWNIRGTRDFFFTEKPEKLTVYDLMDNLVTVAAHGSGSAVKASPMPLIVYGSDEKSPLSLGETDHSDLPLGPFNKRLGAFGSLFGKQVPDADDCYINFMPEELRRFPAEMDYTVTEGDGIHGDKFLSVGLPKQKIDRMVMPYFSCFRLNRDVVIDGKAASLRIWMKGASDWGRIIPVLRDAKGQVWFGSGFKNSWNVDDMPGDSVACFDGWRLLRYELPAFTPWDQFREIGTANWGVEGNRTAKVALPLKLEKFYVERRSGVMYGNSFCQIEKEVPLVFGDIYAEYDSPADMTDEVVRISNILMPEIPASDYPMPLEDFRRNGTLPAGKIVSVTDPETWFNGTQGMFDIQTPEPYASAEIWLSRTPDGKGALCLKSGIKKTPVLVTGFLADTEFYAFVIWRDAKGNVSKPSEPFKFKLHDHFSHQ